MAVTETAQGNIFDRTIESPEIEEAIETLMRAREYAKGHGVGKAKKLVASLVEQYALEDGERLRVGQYVVTGRKRAGGGFEVPTWEKTGIGAIDSIGAD
jgi:hypothetical protein